MAKYSLGSDYFVTFLNEDGGDGGGTQQLATEATSSTTSCYLCVRFEVDGITPSIANAMRLTMASAAFPALVLAQLRRSGIAVATAVNAARINVVQAGPT